MAEFVTQTKELPTELVHAIIDIIGSSEDPDFRIALRKSFFVSRIFHDRSRRYLFRTVTVSEPYDEDEYMRRRMKLLRDLTVDTSDGIIPLVQHISFDLQGSRFRADGFNNADLINVMEVLSKSASNTLDSVSLRGATLRPWSSFNKNFQVAFRQLLCRPRDAQKGLRLNIKYITHLPLALLCGASVYSLDLRITLYHADLDSDSKFREDEEDPKGSGSVSPWPTIHTLSSTSTSLDYIFAMHKDAGKSQSVGKVSFLSSLIEAKMEIDNGQGLLAVAKVLHLSRQTLRSVRLDFPFYLCWDYFLVEYIRDNTLESPLHLDLFPSLQDLSISFSTVDTRDEILDQIIFLTYLLHSPPSAASPSRTLGSQHVSSFSLHLRWSAKWMSDGSTQPIDPQWGALDKTLCHGPLLTKATIEVDLVIDFYEVDLVNESDLQKMFEGVRRRISAALPMVAESGRLNVQVESV